MWLRVFVRVLTVVLALVAISSLSGTADASVGVGVGAAPLTLTNAAVAGHPYTLPVLVVANTGSELAQINLHIQRLSSGGDTLVPSQWITFSRNDFALDPSTRTTVVLTLTVPADATAGTYASDVIATAAAPHRGTQADRGSAAAAAAAAIHFTVTHAPSRAGLPIPSLIGLAAIGGLLAIVLLIWRSGIRLRIERR